MTLLVPQTAPTFTASIWAIFSALLDGPATPQALADRTGFSLARVHKDLSGLVNGQYVEPDGVVRYGAITEHRYRLPSEHRAMNGELQSLRCLLDLVEKGLHTSHQLKQPHVAGLTGVCVTEEVARQAVRESLAFRERLEANQTENGAVKLYVFSSAWTEE